LGFAYIQSDVKNSGSSTVVAWPANSFTYQPGLRIAIGDRGHRHELQLDSGMFWLDEAGSTLSLLSASTSYQYAFMADRSDAPFANIGVGLFREGGADRAATSTTFGAGIGLRHRIHGDHGAVRGEVRADYVKAADAFGRPTLAIVGLRLGFDLWF